MRGREWTGKQWREYQEALTRSEEQWEQSTKEYLDSQPMPDITIDGKPWSGWEPKIHK